MAEISLELVAEVKGALQRMEEFHRKSADALGKVEKSMSSVETVVGKIGGAFTTLKGVAAAALSFIATDKIVDFIGTTIKASSEQQEAVSKLNAAMRATGDFSADASADLLAFAGEMQKTTKHGDDLVVSQLAIAKSFGASNEQSKNLVSAAAELAAATGDTLEGAVQKLGKTLSGNAGKLADQVPALKGFTAEELKAGAALDLIAERFAGMAAAEIQTFGGALAQTTGLWGELHEALGDSIVQNEDVVAAVRAVGAAFGGMGELIGENSEGLKALVSEIAKGFLVVAADTIDAVNELRGAFGDLKGTDVSGFFEGLGTAVRFLAARILHIQRGMVELKILLEKPTAFFISEKDLRKTNLELVPMLDRLESIDKALKNLDDHDPKIVRKETREGLGGVADGLRKAAAGADVAAKGLGDLRAAEEAAARAASESTKTVVLGGAAKKKAAEEAAAAAKKAAAEQQRDEEALARFREGVAKAQVDDFKKIEAARDLDLVKIQEFLAKGTIGFQTAEELRTQVVSNFVDKRQELLQKANEKAVADADKAAQEMRDALKRAFENPLEIAIKAIMGGDVSALQAGMAGAGFANAATQGKEGARALVTEGAARAADAYLGPGAGEALKPLISALTQGPDQTKAMVREFVDALPEMMDNIGEAAPVLVEALVDSLINEGGIVRIAAALVRAVLLEGTFKSIGRQLGIDAGSAFNSSNIAQTFGGAAGKSFVASAKFGTQLKVASGVLRSEIVRGFTEGGRQAFAFLKALPGAFVTGVNAALDGIQQAGFALGQYFSGGSFASDVASGFVSVRDFYLVTYPEMIKRGVMVVWEFYSQTFPALLSQGFRIAAQSAADLLLGAMGIMGGALAEPLRLVLDELRGIITSVVEGFGLFFTSLEETLRPLFRPLQSAMESLQQTPPWIDRLSSVVDRLTNWSPPSLGGGGGGDGGGLGISVGGYKLATGITEVPRGFPNDTFNARLTTGERVVDADANRDLKDFLARQKAGGEPGVLNLLGQILAAVQAPLAAPVSVEVDGRKLADVILNLSRSGARLA